VTAARATSISAGFRLLFADSHLLVLDKPAGLLAVPGRGADKQDCLSTRVQAEFADARVVHRLDMATSGLMLMARGAQMQAALSALFAQRGIEKRYVALVCGRPVGAELPPHDGAWQTIDLPLAADWPRRPLQKVSPEGGKPSITLWRTLPGAAPFANATRVDLHPLTGRTHQLRVHWQAMGHPIVGDALYGNALDRPAGERLMLHATRLSFLHPATGLPVVFESAAPF
jgi:tRNA pseudouridine32 synthase / 23S rRNA pseudouridine746 synthase